MEDDDLERSSDTSESAEEEVLLEVSLDTDDGDADEVDVDERFLSDMDRSSGLSVDDRTQNYEVRTCQHEKDALIRLLDCILCVQVSKPSSRRIARPGKGKVPCSLQIPITRANRK